MSINIKADALARAMSLRGITAAELAKQTGLSAATISHALNGRRVGAQTLRKICLYLARQQVLDGAEELIA